MAWGTTTGLHAPAARCVSLGERLQRWLLRQVWFESVLLPALPRRLRWLLRRAYAAPLDLADRLTGRDRTAAPPRSAVFTGAVPGADLASSGALQLAALERIAGLTPSSHILDVGCGIGRVAIAAATYLNEAGRYEGLDIVPEGIEWCRRHISSLHGNVHFTLADLYNGEYNPKGQVRPSDYRFPFEDDAFDIAVLFSVFTHMLPADVEHYVGELSRVLKPGGRLVATHHLINETSQALMGTKGSGIRFTQNHGTHWTRGGKVDELGIAYDEADIRARLVRHAFGTHPEIYFGGWCGRTRRHDPSLEAMQHLNDGAADGGQDFVVATRS